MYAIAKQIGTIIRKINACLKGGGGGVYSNAKFCYLNIRHPMHRGGFNFNWSETVTYCQQVLFTVKVFIALFVEYPLCFLLCHNLRLHMLKTCSIGKTVLSVSCARFKCHICKLRHPPPHFKTKKPCICPCLSRRRRSTQISRLCPFSSRRQAESTPVQVSCCKLINITFSTIEVTILKLFSSTLFIVVTWVFQ